MNEDGDLKFAALRLLEIFVLGLLLLGGFGFIVLALFAGI